MPVEFVAAFGVIAFAVLSGTYYLYLTLKLTTPDKYMRRRMKFRVIDGGRNGKNLSVQA